MIRLLTLALFLVLSGWSQQTQPSTARAPDCIKPFILVNALDTSGNFDNRMVGCTTWALVYQSVGFTGVTLTFESAPPGTDTTPGAYVTFAGSVSTGVNPNVALTQAYTVFSGFYPWTRAKLTAVVGAGTIRGTFYGYKVH